MTQTELEGNTISLAFFLVNLLYIVYFSTIFANIQQNTLVFY